MNITCYLEDIKAKLAECPLTRHELAAVSGGKVSASWISKFASGHMDNPRIETLVALERALDDARAKRAA